ncbi:tripartite tricarboxylate transporter substrate binding protein [Caldibacillus lycopersici]|uniref:Tripartite tricarboxylate transporter substrate binding protein n=1 Tax=Perspicuibacillus lycopersici TaxID=1325689 RepID=A0AAE3IXU9_9BACI|nr:tripartite tricarboxylate transporter substrate binding protein [Perspicuibacillus lycopersici]MCU9614924.1 tripartite tricarboxylate transporter substrate binding protein [Perspicuibacillus lycopersici]
MKKWRFLLVMFTVLLLLGACGSNASTGNNAGSGDKNYPSQPLTVVVPNSAGGGNDTAARMMSKLLNDLKLVEQPFTIQNKPGGGQAVGMAEFVTKYKDDYGLYLGSPPTIINYLRKEGNSPYGHNDVTPLGLLYSDIAILAVKADSKYKDLASFVADLKANPEGVSIVGGSGPGSQDHLVVMLLADKLGIDPNKVKYVGYDGSSDALTSILGDNGDALATDLSGISEFVKSGDVRILAVASPERLGGELADIPTYQEQGVDLVYYNWRGVFGPKNMSENAIAFWDEKLKELTETEEFQAELAASGFKPGYMNKEDFTQYLKEQEDMFTDILKKLNMLK